MLIAKAITRSLKLDKIVGCVAPVPYQLVFKKINQKKLIILGGLLILYAYNGMSCIAHSQDLGGSDPGIYDYLPTIWVITYNFFDLSIGLLS